MNIAEFKSVLIPPMAQFCGIPIIEADQSGDIPDGPHATYKITSPYIKGVGHAEEYARSTQTQYELRRVEEFKRVVSITAYANDQDLSFELAQKIYDWFIFHGADVLDYNGIVITETTSIQNRDIFVVDEYERRNGFDVTMRITRVLDRAVEWIETAEISEKGGIN